MPIRRFEGRETYRRDTSPPLGRRSEDRADDSVNEMNGHDSPILDSWIRAMFAPSSGRCISLRQADSRAFTGLASLSNSPWSRGGIEFSNPSRFGDRVRELRKARGISQEKLAELSGVDRSYVSQIERGIRNVSLRNIYAIAHGLGVAVTELLR